MNDVKNRIKIVKNGEVRHPAQNSPSQAALSEITARAAAKLRESPNSERAAQTRIVGVKREFALGAGLTLMGITGIGYYALIRSVAIAPILLIASFGILALGMAAMTVGILDRVGVRTFRRRVAKTARHDN